MTNLETALRHGSVSKKWLDKPSPATRAEPAPQGPPSIMAELVSLRAENAVLRRKLALETTPLGSRGKVRIIKKIVALAYEVGVTDLESSRRHVAIVRPRQIVCYLAREHTALSFPEIGRLLGGRDHTTILHGWVRIKELRGQDMALAGELATLEARINRAWNQPQ